MLLGLMFTLPRYAGLDATQPANLGKLVARHTTRRKKRPLMSDWRHRGRRRSHSTQRKRPGPSAAWYRHAPKALAAQHGPLDCQAGRGRYVRLPCHAAPSRDIVVVHSPDLHIDHDYTARLHGGDGTAGLSGVLSAARAAGAYVVVLAGDTFDCHRVPIDLLERAAAVISA